MALEAQDAVVRLMLKGGTAFQAEADRSAAALAGVRKEAELLKVQQDTPAGKAGLLNMLASGAAAANLSKFGNKLDHISKKSLQLGRQTAYLSGGIALALGESVKEWVQAQGSFTLLEAQAGATKRQREELEKQIPLFAKLAQGPKEYADALYPVQSVFKNVTKDIEVMTTAAKVAAIGHDSLAASAEAMTAFWSDKPRGIKSVAEAGALLERTAALGKMRLPELTDTFKTGLFQSASAMGIDARSVLALVASVSQGVSQGGVEQFTNRARTMITKMVALKGEALKAAKQLGFSKYELSEKLSSGPKGFLEILNKLKESESSIGEQKWKADVSTLFGGSRSAGAAFTAMIAAGANATISKELGLIHGEGAINTMMKKTETSPQFQVHKALAEVKAVGYEIGKMIGPSVVKFLKDFVEVLKGGISFFKELPGPMKKLLEGFVMLGLIISPASFLFAGIAGLAAAITKLAVFALPGLASEAGIAAGTSGLAGLNVAIGLASAALIGFAANKVFKWFMGLFAGTPPKNINEWQEILLYGGVHRSPWWIEHHRARGTGHRYGHEKLTPVGGPHHPMTPHEHKLHLESLGPGALNPELYRQHSWKSPVTGRTYYWNGPHMPAEARKAQEEAGPQSELHGHKQPIILHTQVNLDGKKIGESRRVIEGIHKAERERTAHR